MTEILEHGYSSESTQLELSNEYQHDRVLKIFWVLVLWMRIASAFQGFSAYCYSPGLDIGACPIAPGK